VSLAVFVSVCALMCASPGEAASPTWERAYDLPRSGSWISSLAAEGDVWIAGGKEILVRGGTTISTAPVPGKTVLGLSKTSQGFLALGADQLIMRLEGKDWVQEHFAPAPAKSPTRTKYTLVLYSARNLASGPTAPLVAYGPRSVLVRRADGTWVSPPENERDRLSRLAQLGPEGEAPVHCAPDAWRWLSGARGLLTCHDGRSFLREGSATKPAGSLPKPCRTSVDALDERDREIYLVCGGQLWRSSDERWTRVSAPKGLRAFAASDRCLFAADDKSVWRSCSK